jgi:hypothetical protein
MHVVHFVYSMMDCRFCVLFVARRTDPKHAAFTPPRQKIIQPRYSVVRAVKRAAKRRKDDGETMAKLRKSDVSPLQADTDDFIDPTPGGHFKFLHLWPGLGLANDTRKSQGRRRSGSGRIGGRIWMGHGAGMAGVGAR